MKSAPESAPTGATPSLPGQTARPARVRARKRRRWPWIVGGILVVVIGLSVAGSIAKKKAAASIPVTTDKATVRTIVQTVTATGKIQPEIEVKISPEIYGEITALPFREGAYVHKGELIIRIKPDLYQAQVEQQVAAVAAAKASAGDMHAKMVKAEADLVRYKDLYHRNLISESDFIGYTTALDVTKADYESAQASVDQATGLLKQAQDALSKTDLYAPMDGTVSSLSSEVGERVVATGQFAGTEIMRIADLGSMEARVKVNENDIVNVKVGDVARISVDAYPDRKITGLVREIASSADNAGGSGSGSSSQASAASTDQVTNFIVKIRITDRGVTLRPGMSATADIETQSAPKVIAVPIQSVTVRDEGGLSAAALEKKNEKDAKDRSGTDLDVKNAKDDARHEREQLQRIVFVKEDGKVRAAKVETGIADNAFIEIKSGIKAGDEVVSGSYAAISRKLKDGAAVRIEAPKPEAEDDGK